MKWPKRKNRKSLSEIAAEEMSGIFSAATLKMAFMKGGYSEEIAIKEAKKRKMDFLGPLYYEPK